MAPPIILLLGPTASGKSALASALAQRLDGVVVNADSMQVYRDLRVLTARPTEQEELAVPHRLYGFVDAAERFSVGAWLAAAARELATQAAAGRAVIVAGGTGLYFKALTDGLAEIPKPSDAVRAALAARLAAEGAPSLHLALKAVDPETAARLAPNDSVRIVRALEVFEAAGSPISAFHRQAPAPLLAPGSYGAVALIPPRAALYAKIDARFDAMLGSGALEEARMLAARGLDPALPAMKAHGMPHLAAHFAGSMSLEEATYRGKLDTRHYAKRQFTWIANQARTWRRIEAEDLGARVDAALASCRL